MKLVPAIRIRGLGKYFGTPVEVDGVEHPREALQALLRVVGFRVQQAAAAHEIQRTVVEAGHVLRDLSLDIERGSVVCLAGEAGAGKSVLLRILAGSMQPTAGRVEIFDTVTSLLAVGENLDARCTAHENIRSSKRFLEARPDAAERYAAEVVEFAGLHDFEHVPLRTYSTGMLLRLSIALALCGRPSIVLIDDVLRVGDIAFQQKCADRVRALKDLGCTLVLAFSDEKLVQQIATRVITLGGGGILDDTTPGQWMAQRHASRASDATWRILQHLPENDLMALRSISVEAGRGSDESCLDVSLGYEAKVGGLGCRPSLVLVRKKPVRTVFRTLYPQVLTVDDPRSLTFTVRIPTHELSDGDYGMTVAMNVLQGGAVHSLKADHAVSLRLRRSAADQDAAAASEAPLLTVTLPWEVETLAREDA